MPALFGFASAKVRNIMICRGVGCADVLMTMICVTYSVIADMKKEGVPRSEIDFWHTLLFRFL